MNSAFSAISILKLSDNFKNEEAKLIRDEKMLPLYKNIHLLHADDCPMMMFNKSLESCSLEINLSEFNTSQTIKFAAVGIVQDKNVNYFFVKKGLFTYHEKT